MTNVQQFIDRQYGNYTLKNYDPVFKYLRCEEKDEFSGIGSYEEANSPIFACRFAQKQGYEYFLALANEEGQIAIHDIRRHSFRNTTQAHYNAIFDLAWMFGQMKIVTVSGDHTARLFHISESEITEERIFHGHTRSIKTVAFRKEDPAVFATGSRDGSIYLWDTRANAVLNNYIRQPDTIISNSHNIPCSASKMKKKVKVSQGSNVSAANSVTSLVFQDDNTLISCGAGDGVIKVWDMRKNYLVHKREPVPKYTLPHVGGSARNGFSNLVLDSSGSRLYANCMDSTIYSYSLGGSYSSQPVACYTGHHNLSFYIKAALSPDGSYLLSGSSDYCAYIWAVDGGNTPLTRLRGHSAEVTCVSWCPAPGPPIVVTCSDDMKYKVWRVNPSASGAARGSPSPVRLSPRKRTLVSCTRLSKQPRVVPTSIDTASRPLKRTPDQQPTSPAAKRQRTPRRLFEEQRGSHGELATLLEESELLLSPPGSPHLATASPTANLPNYVVDGEAPHLTHRSPRKRRAELSDWLTRLRTEHQLRCRLSELNAAGEEELPPAKRARRGSSPNTSPVPGLAPPVASRKLKRSGSQSPLLRFFKVINSPSRSLHDQQQQHCSPLLHNKTNKTTIHINPTLS